ncbi:MAG: hypothetical protein V3V75_02375 [Thermoguttaceae bacterium]
MVRSEFSEMRWCGRFLATSLIVVCATLSGCCNFCPGGSGAPDRNRPSWPEDIRPPDARSEFFGYSNEARQVEQHLQR